jgi:repressor LexA
MAEQSEGGGMIGNITPTQLRLLSFIRAHITQHGVSPSFSEMKNAMGLASKSGIHRLLEGLSERGYVKRMAHRSRGLDLTEKGLKKTQEMGS